METCVFDIIQMQICSESFEIVRGCYPNMLDKESLVTMIAVTSEPDSRSAAEVLEKKIALFLFRLISAPDAL